MRIVALGPISLSHLVINNMRGARTLFGTTPQVSVLKGTRTFGLGSHSRFIDPCRSYLNTYMVRYNIVCLPFSVKAPNTKHPRKTVAVLHLATKETKM
jgi:hypothetical protein